MNVLLINGQQISSSSSSKAISRADFDVIVFPTEHYYIRTRNAAIDQTISNNSEEIEPVQDNK